jgi:hypothetical protein
MFQISDFFKFWNICIICNNISWRWDPSLNVKFIYVSYVSYTQSLKVILDNNFSVLSF